MGVLRSEKMRHGTLVLPNDRAREFVDILGRQSNMQFVDMNTVSMVRPYRRYIQRLDEMVRILRFLEGEIEKLPGAEIMKSDVESFLEYDNTYQLEKVEESLQKLYGEFVQFRNNNSDMITQRNAAIEERAVAKTATLSLSPNGILGDTGKVSDTQSLLENDVLEDGFASNIGSFRDECGIAFSNIAGVILQEDKERFARALFRTTRGNTYTHFDNLTDTVYDSKTGLPIQKAVFVIYFQGTSSSALYEKISKICIAFGVNIYPWPSTYEKANQVVEELNLLITDKQRALDAYEQYFIGEISILLEVSSKGGNSLVEEWRLFCMKEKAIYATLNLFEGTDITLRADCWYPEDEEEAIREILSSNSNSQQVSAFLLSDNNDQSRVQGTPPTYIKTNSFTSAYQVFVDTYGVPCYQEANPALFTIISFPFLFGIMYGDVGHGFIILLAGIYLVFTANKFKNDGSSEIMSMLYGGRYMILLMGLFATYCGFLYNDFFALGFDFFGTRYTKAINSGSEFNEIYELKKGITSVYPFGFDPIWKGATNELTYMNSFKMKFSMIIAFLQMGLGVLLKGSNAIHFKKPLDFIFEFIPQIIFMVCFVGYLNFLIIFKWVTPVGEYNKPSILGTLIALPSSLMGGKIPDHDIMFNNQQIIQCVLVILLLISIPLMLIPKPLILMLKAKKVASHKLDDKVSSNDHDHDHEHEDTSEIFIHQLIETIEFVLGIVSNTASYLRLWALSLAHNMLSIVFFENSIRFGLLYKGLFVKSIILFFTFFIFAGATFGVMVCMDSLECFLHALRLQWVEFQSKFYKGDGVPFVPYSHSRILSELEGS